MPQIHLRAEEGDYAPLVLLPGDPNRARRIPSASTTASARQVNDHRGLLGFTGTYRRHAGERPDQRDGDAEPEHRGRGAAATRREAPHPGRDLRRDREGAEDGRPRHRHGRVPGRRRDARRTFTASRTRPPRTSSSPARWSTRPARPASRHGPGSSHRSTSSTTPMRTTRSAGASGACSPSRWRPRRSSSWPPRAGVQAACALTVSATSCRGGQRPRRRYLPLDELDRAIDRMIDGRARGRLAELSRHRSCGRLERHDRYALARRRQPGRRDHQSQRRRRGAGLPAAQGHRPRRVLGRQREAGRALLPRAVGLHARWPTRASRPAFGIGPASSWSRTTSASSSPLRSRPMARSPSTWRSTATA